MRRASPRLKLLLREGQTAGLLEELASGALDAALVALPVEADALEIEAPGDLAGAGVLLLEEGHCLREQALEVCGAAGAASEELKATSLETLAHMVASGVGCTLLPALAAGPQGARGAAQLEIRRFRRPAPRRTVGLVWRLRYAYGETLRGIAQRLRDDLPEGVMAARNPPAGSRQR
jgi:LysR family hydrogen peroxide-inducible transcriptional activator